MKKKVTMLEMSGIAGIALRGARGTFQGLLTGNGPYKRAVPGCLL